MKISTLFARTAFLGAVLIVVIPQTIFAATPISTCQELQDVRNNLSGNYYLANNIDCAATSTWNGGAGFEPIGTPDTPFTGTLDGKDHKISNLYINRPDPWPDDEDVGLFGFVDDGCEIHNVSLVKVDITGASSAGGLVALTGLIADITIRNCNVSGSVSGGYGVGGLVGYNRGGTISACYSTATVSGDGDIFDYTGGFVGINNHGGKINFCFSTGNVTAGGSRSGGFAGSNTGNISQCFTTGSISGQHAVGGFVGENNSTTVNGHFAGIIQDCYAVGDVSGTDWVGGFAGINWGVPSLTSVIENCYSAGKVTGATNTGGFVGRVGEPYEILNCYWDILKSGQFSSAGGTGKTTVEMKQQATYNSWDFTNIWDITESIHYAHLVPLRSIHNMIAMVYDTDVDGANEFKSLLRERDYFVNLVQKAAVVEHNLGQYQLVIVSSDTAIGYDWGTDDQVAAIGSVDAPILGLGYGGTALFQEVGLSINSGNSWSTWGHSIHVPNPHHCLFRRPNSIPISHPNNVRLYIGSDFKAEYEPVLNPAVKLFGRQEDDDLHWILVQEGKDFLWGFSADPSAMTTAGEDLFHNVINHLTVGCSPDDFPWELFIPAFIKKK